MKVFPTICAILLCLSALGGCKKENCEKLLQVACDHVAEEEDGDVQCESLREKAETVEDAQCAEILQLLKDSGKLQSLR